MRHRDIAIFIVRHHARACTAINILQIIGDGRMPSLKSRRRVIHLTRNLDAETESHPVTGRLTRIANFENSR